MSNAPTKRVTSVIKTTANGRLVRVVKVTAVPVPQELAVVVPPAPAVEKIVDAAAQKYSVDPLLVHSVIQVESNYNQYAVSPKGAQGLMQLIPSTAKRFGASDSFDAQENIEAGVKYLKFLQNRYNDNIELALAAYNAGEGAVAKYNNSVPPFKETQQYVAKVGQKYGHAKLAAAATAKQQAAVQPPPAPVEEYRHVEEFKDQDGRIFLRTR